MLVTPKKAMKNWLGGFELLTFSKATTRKDGVVAIMQTGAKSLCKYVSPEREKVRQRGSGAESQARALRADQGLYTRN